VLLLGPLFAACNSHFGFFPHGIDFHWCETLIIEEADCWLMGPVRNIAYHKFITLPYT
jgi:hypothetical protein